MIKPVKHIEISNKDRFHLDAILRNRASDPAAAVQPATYRDRVVVKPWGYEFLIFENPEVAVWFLRVKKDHATSMHCHPAKRTSLTLLSGKALCNTFRHRNFLCAGDSLNIEAGVFHSTKALSLDGLFVIETETPNMKTDLVRLEDKYGRAGLGYEGFNRMCTDNLGEFEYFRLEEGDGPTSRYALGRLFSISLERYSSADDFSRMFRIEAGATYCVCHGSLKTSDGGVMVSVGETERGTYLTQAGRLATDGDLLLMKMAVFN